jgi:flotillin
MKTHEGAVNQAKVDVAEAKYRGDVGAKEREGLTRRETAKVEAETVLIENERKVSIAQANMNLATKESEFERAKKIAAIEAAQAAKMRESELQKQVEERRLLSETERLRVEYVSKATAEYEAAKANADARLYEKQKEAEGLLAIYNAQVQGIKNLMNAFGGDHYAALQYIMIDREQLAKENANAIQGLNPNITVWNTGNETNEKANHIGEFVSLC